MLVHLNADEVKPELCGGDRCAAEPEKWIQRGSYS
jgi:hypothetical protein